MSKVPFFLLKQNNPKGTAYDDVRSSHKIFGSKATRVKLFTLENAFHLSNTTVSKGNSVGGGYSGNGDNVNANFSQDITYEKSKILATTNAKINVEDTKNSDDLSQLNRDTTNTDKDIFNAQSSVQADLKVDTRMLSEEGWKEIKDDIITSSAITQSIERIMSSDKKGISDFFSETKMNVDVYEGLKKELASNPELVSQLENPNLIPSQKQAMLQNITNTVKESLGYKVEQDDVKLISTDKTGANNTKFKGHYNSDGKGNGDKNTYINDKNNDSEEDLVSTVGHEAMHNMDEQDNIYIQNDTEQNKYATEFGEDVGFYTQHALDYTSGGSLASTNTHNNGQVTSTPSVFNDNTMVDNSKYFNNNVDVRDGDDLSATDGADISRHVYKSQKTNVLPKHIKEITDEETLNKYGLNKKDLVNEKTGFKSSVYINSETGEVTYGYAGTDGFDWKDIKTNAIQGMGLTSDAYKQGITNAEKFNKATQKLGVKASVTGHSMGGGLAAAASEKTGLEAKTYNAAGVHPITVTNGKGTENIDNYYMEHDPLTIIQQVNPLVPTASGKQHQLESTNEDASIIKNVQEGHSIETIIKNSNLKDKE